MAETEVLRFVVSQSDCDHLGHMNLSRYFGACGDAVFALQARLGLDREDIAAGRRLSFAVVHAESDFRAEVLVGEVLTVSTEILEIGNKSMRFHHRMRRGDGSLVFESRFKCVLLDLETRRAAPVPADIAKRARVLMAGPG